MHSDHRRDCPQFGHSSAVSRPQQIILYCEFVFSVKSDQLTFDYFELDDRDLWVKQSML